MPSARGLELGVEGQLELADHEADQAAELALGEREALVEEAADGGDQIVARGLGPARCSGAMDAVEPAELVDREAVEVLLAQEVALPQGHGVEGAAQGGV